MRSPIEAKVAAGGITGLVVTVALQLLQSYVHGFHPPTAATIAAILTVVSSAAAWLVPHTPRPAPPVTVAITSPGTTPAQVIAAIRQAAKSVGATPAQTGYQPAAGPDEPSAPPAGPASASPPATGGTTP